MATADVNWYLEAFRVVIPALIAIFVGYWITRSNENFKTFLAKDIETFRTERVKDTERLKTELAKDTEKFKTELAKEIQKFQTLHGKRIAALESFLSKLREIEAELELAVSISLDIDYYSGDQERQTTELTPVAIRLRGLMSELKVGFEPARIYFDPNTCLTANEIIEEVDDTVSVFVRHYDEDNDVAWTPALDPQNSDFLLSAIENVKGHREEFEALSRSLVSG